jgi:hypothetical protein
MWQLTMWEPAAQPAGKPTTQATVVAEQAQLNRLRKQVDDRWRALAQAQERGAQPSAADALERLYDAYMRAVDAYVARQRALTRSRGEQRRAS